LKAKIIELESYLDDPQQFRLLYQWAFGFAKESDQRSLSVDMALPLWTLLFANSPSKHVSLFIQFLTETPKIKVITKDQWFSFLDFITTTDEQLSQYDESSACNAILDLMVE
jgi:DCN1-like protein 4/5